MLGVHVVAALQVAAGIGWVEAIRSSQRLVHGFQQQPGNLVIRRLVDLGVMVGIFVLPVRMFLKRRRKDAAPKGS